MGKGSETHNLRLILSLQDKASKGLSSHAKLLRSLKKDYDSLFRSIDKLNKKFGTGTPRAGRTSRPDAKAARDELRAAREVARIKQQTARQAAQQDAVRARAATRLTALQTQQARQGMRRESNALIRQLRDDQAIPRSRRTRQVERAGIFDRVERVNDFMQATGQVRAAFRDRIDSLRNYTDEATRLYRAQERFKIIGLAPQENARAFAAVREQVKDLRGITLTDTTENMLDLVGALGDVNQAVRALPLASKYKLGFETLFGDTFDKAQINEQVRASFKFLELTGNTMKGTKQMEEMLDTITKIGASTGGRVTPQDLLMMARRGSPAVQSLSATGLRNVSTLIEDMGAEQTGTALQSLYSALVAGAMKDSSAEAFRKFGLIDESKIKFGRAQQIKQLLPGANKLGALLQDDPLKAADALMAAMKSKGVDTSDSKAVQEQLSILFQNRNAFRLMNMLTTQREQIMKESGRAAQSKGVTQIYDQLQGSDLMKLKEYEAAMADFRVTMGQGILPVATQLANALTPLAKTFAEYPALAKYGANALLVSKGLGMILETSALINQARVPRMLSDIRAGISALPSSKVTTIGVNGIPDAERKVLGLQGKLNAIAGSPWRVTVQFLVAGVAIEQILEWKREHDERQRTYAQQTGSLRETYDTDVATGRAYSPQRPKGELDDRAAQLLSAMKMDRSLELSLEPTRAGLFEHFWTSQRPYDSRWSTKFGDNRGSQFDPQRFAQYWKNTPQMQDPHILSRLLLKIDKGEMGLSPTGSEKLKQGIAASTTPEVYQQATKLAAEETGKLAAQSQKVNESFINIPATVTRVNSALDSFSFKLDSIQPPTFVTFPVPSVGTTPPPRLPGITQQPFTFGAGKARGGRVLKGISYPVGERGVELYTPNATGFITPNNELQKFGVMNRALNADRKRGSQLPLLQARNADAVRESSYVSSTPSSTFSREISIGNISVTVQAGESTGRIDERKLARLIGSEVARQVQEAVNSRDVYSNIEAHLDYRSQRRDELS